jgi:hypothetical protein
MKTFGIHLFVAIKIITHCLEKEELQILEMFEKR